MQTMICGQVTDLSPSKAAELMTAAWRLDVARHLHRIKGVPGEQAAKLRAELEDELQACDEVANQVRARP
jgi:hypothetical protein